MHGCAILWKDTEDFIVHTYTPEEALDTLVSFGKKNLGDDETRVAALCLTIVNEARQKNRHDMVVTECDAEAGTQIWECMSPGCQEKKMMCMGKGDVSPSIKTLRRGDLLASHNGFFLSPESLKSPDAQKILRGLGIDPSDPNAVRRACRISLTVEVASTETTTRGNTLH